MKSSILLLVGANAFKLEQNQKQRILSNLRFEESEGPTKADLGEDDENIVPRMKDLGPLDEKENGWINPLSIADDGMGDDLVVDMSFEDKKKKSSWYMPEPVLDEDIVASLKSEAQAEK